MKLTARDRIILVILPVLLTGAIYWFGWYTPAVETQSQLEKSIASTGVTPEAWQGPRTRAEKAAAEAAQARATAEADYRKAAEQLAREKGNAGERRSKPSALAALNRAAAASSAAVVSAVSRNERVDDSAAAGIWEVTFLATYKEMAACLKALAEEPGVVVRRIDRTAAKDSEAKPIWNLVIQM